MIQVNHLTFGYTKDHLIFDDISFNVHKQQLTVLLGKNGAGKTTLLNLIDGVLKPISGDIIKTEHGVLILDQPELYDYLTGREYLDVVLALIGQPFDDQMMLWLDRFNLTHELDKLILYYSLGMKHKLALVTAMVLGVRLYLMDEPLTSLDPESQRFMIDRIKQLKDMGNTFLISTHMMHVAYELADNIIILNSGKILQIANDFSDYYAFERYVLENMKISF